MIPASVSEYLNRNHARYSIMSHPAAYTAQEEAAAAHVPGREWAKSVVCFADDQPILAVVPATCAVDLDRLQRAAHAQSIRLARETEFAPFYQDCEPGAMPPLGPLFGQRVFVDQRLTADPEVVFTGGSHRDAIRMSFREFERLAHPVVAEFASGPVPAPPTRTMKPIDPVCGATVEESTAAGWSERRGETYYFCCLGCKMQFDDNPDGYVRASST
jgi:Ala-tRNA(Pro) deacylase